MFSHNKKSRNYIIVAPQELSGDNEEGWTVVSSKITLRRLKKISKKQITRSVGSTSSTSDQEVIQASSDNRSIKSGDSSTSWSSIVKRSMKMNIPKVNIDITSITSSKSSNKSTNEEKFIKSIKNPSGTKTTSEVPIVSPPRIINVSYSKVKGTPKSLFHDNGITIEDQDNNNKEFVQNEETQSTEFVPSEQNESEPDRETQKEKKRILRLLLVQPALPK